VVVVGYLNIPLRGVSVEKQESQKAVSSKRIAKRIA